MTPSFYIQFNTGDVAGVHPGYRGVTVKKLGRKWVHCALSATGRNFRMRVAAWNALTKHPVKTENIPL